ncbi:5-formyltetrahydrofolate cyclo-ligase, partial [Bacillus sp. WP8]|uniref:5-formyltetrahydrofolate cyclo-ligase n=1 Tax=Bacillus sp. WP8 TaxID=756828 RepID=UPI0037C069C6
MALTISTAKHLPTIPLIQKPSHHPKTLSLPTSFPQTKHITFYKYTPQTNIISPYFPLFHPHPLPSPPPSKKSIHFIILPGVCFHPQAYRIGYRPRYYHP